MKLSDCNTDILYPNHIEEIQSIWVESLPENMKSILGNSIIKIYLNKFFRSKSSLGFGLFKSKELAGFVLFGDDSKILNEILKEKFIYLIFSFFSKFLTLNLKSVYRYFEVVLFMFFARSFEKELNNKNTELLIIGFKKNYQNKGLGTFMMNENFSKNKNYFSLFKNIYVKTLKSTPQNIRFYEKNNFKVIKEIFGRIYLKLNISN